MINRATCLIITILAVGGCSGPIETRVETHKAAALPGNSHFTFAKQSEAPNEAQISAEKLVSESLQAKNLQPADDGGILVQLSISERPANIAITVGEKESENNIAEIKKQKFLQQCKDVEHRLSVSLFNQSNGLKLYSGSAAEYHCKGRISESLPYLVDAAMSGLETPVSSTKLSSIRTRTGVE